MATNQILILSAKTKEQLYIQVQQLIGTLELGSLREEDFLNICYTLQIGREHMDARLAIISDSIEDAKNLLIRFDKEKIQSNNIYVNTDKELVIIPGGSEEEINAFLKALVDHQKFYQIAELWVKGFDFNWEVMYQGINILPCCVSLPSYPFEKERFWIRDVISTSKQRDHELMFFREQWIVQAINAEHVKKYDNILVFIPQGVDAELIKTSVNAQNVYVIRQTDNIEEELDHLKSHTNYLDAVWYINNQIGDLFHSSVLLFQNICKAELSVHKITLFGVYENDFEKACLDSCIGFERSLKLVMPKTSFHVIFGDKDSINHAEALKILQQEMNQRQGKSVWYDHGIRKVTSLSEEQLEDGKSIVKHNGVYCIIGGMGGLGSVFARWLSQIYSARLLLMGRRPKNQVKLAQLGKECPNLEYVQADILDAPALEDALGHVKDKYGKIDGILNCAGLAGGSSIMDKSWEEFETVLKPNIDGTVILENIAEKIGVGFIAYFCSSAAILGDFGSCCYAVGKRFQQSYVSGMNGSLKRVVINWPLWKSDGMKLEDEQSNSLYMKSSGQKLLDEERGTRLFDKLLYQPDRQHLVFYAIRDRAENVIENLNAKGKDVPIELTDGMCEVKVNPAMTGNAGNDIPVEKQCILDLKNIISKITGLRIEKITTRADFAEMGFDSITLEEFVNYMSTCFKIPLAPDIFFNYPTIGKLGKYLCEKYEEQLSMLYSEVKPQDQFKEEVSFREAVRPEQNGGTDREKISVVGISGRFPESRNTNELWEILESGKDVTREVTGEREGWNSLIKFSEDDPMSGKRKMGVVPGIYEFDTLFFTISPREAGRIDPRQRLLLEETWRALEDAGYGRSLLDSERIGVFIGAEESDYNYQNGKGRGIATNSMAALAGRIGYFLNLKGPNMVIDTACSSSLVAFNQACLTIESGMCDAAIVAGISILSTSADYELMEKSQMISPDGICHAFDRKANGMIPAEAVSVVVLKRESKAKKDRHQIYGNVIGYGVNYDGKTNGLTAPSGNSQRDLIKDCYDRFNIDKCGTDLIVTHGTGTRLGDSIEINALSEAFSDDTKENHCALISFKPNIGHALAASGLVSLIGLLLAIKNEKIPATIHCESVNEYINWNKSPFYLNKQVKEWKREEGRLRRAGVSGFGITGTNAFVLLEETDPIIGNEAETLRPFYIFCFSAKSPDSLRRNLYTMKEYLSRETKNSLADISFTLAQGRMHLQYRSVVIGSDRNEMIAGINLILEGKKTENIFTDRVSKHFEKEDEQLNAIRTFYLEKDAGCEEYLEGLRKLAKYYCQGYEEIGEVIYKDADSVRLHIPAYMFQHKEYQVETSEMEPDNVIKVQENQSKVYDGIAFQTVIYGDDFEEE